MNSSISVHHTHAYCARPWWSGPCTSNALFVNSKDALVLVRRGIMRRYDQRIYNKCNGSGLWSRERGASGDVLVRERSLQAMRDIVDVLVRERSL